MNRRKAMLHVLLFAVLITSVVTGCSEEGNGSSPLGPGPVSTGIPPGLVAAWVFESVTMNGYPIDLSYVMDWADETVTAGFVIDADGTYTYVEIDGEGEVVWMNVGTITVSGTHFTITITSDLDGSIDTPEVMSGTWAMNGNVLTLSVVEDGDTYLFTSVK